MSDKKTKTQKTLDAINKAEAVAEMGNIVPGAAPIIAEVEMGAELAKEGIGIFAKLKAMFGKKK